MRWARRDTIDFTLASKSMLWVRRACFQNVALVNRLQNHKNNMDKSIYIKLIIDIVFINLLVEAPVT